MTRRRTATTVLLLAAFLPAACSTTVAGQGRPDPLATGAIAASSAPGTPSAPATTAAPPAAVPPLTRLAGRWTGTYLCNQGKTALTLTLADSAIGSTLFDFSADPSNPGVPSGSYSMTAAFEGPDLVFTPSAWISRPDAYIMVGLRVPGPVDPSTTVLRGTVTGEGCTTFEVFRKVD